MKKRRELDALVNSGKPTKNGRHELLRNESESSEVEEFTMPHKSAVRKRVRSQCCSTCLTMCGSFLILVCVVAIGGLIWMVAQLKYDVTDLQNRLASAEVDFKNIKVQLNELSSCESDLKSTVGSLTSSESGFPKLQMNVTELKGRLSVVNTTLLQLAESFKSLHVESSQSGLTDVQDTVTRLSRTLAYLGSNYQSVQLQQTIFATQLNGLQNNVTALQITKQVTLNSTPSPSSQVDKIVLQNLQQELTKYSIDLTTVNETLSQKYEYLYNLTLVQNDDLMNVKNWTLQLWKDHDELNKLDVRVINSTVVSEVKKFLRSSTGLSNTTSIFARFDVLESRVAALEFAGYNQTSDVFAHASDVFLINQTLRQYFSLSLLQDKTLNDTVWSFADRVRQMETAFESGKLVNHDFVIPATAVVEESHTVDENVADKADVPTTAAASLSEAKADSAD